MKTLLRILMWVVAAPIVLHAAEPSRNIRLPPPQIAGGKPLMQALQQRRTTREFGTEAMPRQILADLLWAGFGINRPESGHRTAPSAMNSQEIDLYVALPEGLYVYEPKAQQLRLVLSEDIRRRVSGQEFLKNAPAVLIFVADLPRLSKARPETRIDYARFDAGCISQNVYLFCASAGLATVVFDLDRPPLSALMQLKPEQQIIMAQAVGYPAKIDTNGRRDRESK